jgi:hypothetical protein
MQWEISNSTSKGGLKWESIFYNDIRSKKDVEYGSRFYNSISLDEKEQNYI